MRDTNGVKLSVNLFGFLPSVEGVPYDGTNAGLLNPVDTPASTCWFGSLAVNRSHTTVWGYSGSTENTDHP